MHLNNDIFTTVTGRRLTQHIGPDQLMKKYFRIKQNFENGGSKTYTIGKRDRENDKMYLHKLRTKIRRRTEARPIRSAR